MVEALIAALILAVLAAVFFMIRVGSSSAAEAAARKELEATKARVSAAESDAKKAADALEAKRKEADELKDRLKDAKKKRFDEKEAQKGKKDLLEARIEIEREMEQKMALLREEAETERKNARRLQAELDSFRGRKPAAPPAEAAPVAAAPEAKAIVEDKRAEPPRVREATPEEKARLEAAEKSLAKARARAEELEAEVKKFKGRAETDRRVFVVQKGELDIAKDRFRSLEQRFNALTLERDRFFREKFELERKLGMHKGEGVEAVSRPEGATVVPPAGESADGETVPPAGDLVKPVEVRADVEIKPRPATPKPDDGVKA